MAKLEFNKPNCFLKKLVFNDDQYFATRQEPIVDLQFGIVLYQLLYLVRSVNSSVRLSLTRIPVELAHCSLPSAYIKVLDVEYSVAARLGFLAIALLDVMPIAAEPASNIHLASLALLQPSYLRNFPITQQNQ